MERYIARNSVMNGNHAEKLLAQVHADTLQNGLSGAIDYTSRIAKTDDWMSALDKRPTSHALTQCWAK